MAIGSTGIALEEPIPAPRGEPAQPASSPGEWIRKNLFNSWYNTLLTVLFTALLGWVAFKAGRFLFLTARWEIIRVNLTDAMVGGFPRDQLSRIWVGAWIAAAAAGISAGARQRRGAEVRLWRAVRRAAPLLLLAVVLLALARTATPLALTLIAAVAAASGWLLGRRLPGRVARRLPLVWIVGAAGFYAALTAFGGVGWDEWGGLLLTLFLAVGGIVLSFPVGVLLALGRRSRLPAVRVVCVAYIEFVRGVPLIAVLFIGASALGFLFPLGFNKPSEVTRALIALIAFTAAYLAEVVRGGLQSVPRGQVEAAQAIGLSPLKATLLIVLPQALRNVIPAIVGQFISLFKDTALVAIIGLADLLHVARTMNLQGAFLGQGLYAETLVFASFIYWAFCYSMSRASQRLERRLGVGER